MPLPWFFIDSMTAPELRTAGLPELPPAVVAAATPAVDVEPDDDDPAIEAAAADAEAAAAVAAAEVDAALEADATL